MTAATLLCPVRGCGEPLDTRETAETALRCPRGHAFDRARSGYVNLLQPQDRRARHPGDTREAAQARRRLFAAGVFDALLDGLKRELAALPLPPRPSVLDVGCGEGSVLRALAAEGGDDLAAHGVDISAPAIDLAARAFPAATWVVANADRRLPWAGASFDALLSITARRNAREFRRLLAPGGRVLVAVPAADDLAELREAVLGEGILRERLDRALAELEPHFELERRSTARQVARLEPTLLQDLLAATYRGARHAERERAAALSAMVVTSSHDLAVLRPRA